MWLDLLNGRAALRAVPARGPARDRNAAKSTDTLP